MSVTSRAPPQQNIEFSIRRTDHATPAAPEDFRTPVATAAAAAAAAFGTARGVVRSVATVARESRLEIDVKEYVRFCCL